jgi:hypothetical protein
MRKAMALRVKYRRQHKVGSKFVSKIRLAVRTLAVHMKNRAGVYPNGEVCKGLGKYLLQEGFSREEADHAGVCVENVPKNLQSKEVKDILERNKEKVAGVEELSTCFDDREILFGTLSHSQLVLVPLCWMTGAPWHLMQDDGAPYMCTEEGCLDIKAIADVNNAVEMLQIIREGIEVEVLAYQIYMEEPDGCSLTSQALSGNSGIVLRTTELTALECLTSQITMMFETTKAEEIAFASVKEALRKQLDVYVDDPEFVEMFDFAINLGAKKNSFIPCFLTFAARFVNSKKRSLRLSAFTETNKIPPSCPRVKIAVLKRAYRKKPVHGICPAPEALWGKKNRTGTVHVGRVAAILSYRASVCSCGLHVS